ncbi:MAG: DedA family protein [Burkholderiales bacterium]|nr:DedA family protein [Burkholderiales bacterium]
MDILQHLIEFFSQYGYIAVFLVLVICGFGVPIPEDITLVSGGVICGLAATQLNVHVMVMISFCGVLVGDSIMFMLGRILGEKVKTLPLLRLIFTERVYAKMQQKATRYGSWILFVARFLPGLRSAIFVTAGVSRKVSFWRFFAFDGVAALISVPVWVYAGYYFAHDMDKLVSWIKNSEKIVIFAFIALIVGIVIFLIIKKNNRYRKYLDLIRHRKLRDK